MKFTIILLLSPFLTIGQNIITGKVINHKSKEPISFATIGLMKENIGTNALEDGSFSLVSTKRNDTLLFSCIGYATLKLPIVNNNYTFIELVAQEKVLEEVIVTNKNSWASKTLNDFSKCGNNFVGSNGYTTQLAQHFQASEENLILTEIKICRMSTSILNPEKTTFRIRIYDIDSLTKSPSTDLCDQIIEVRTKSKIINLNLEKYKIRIPNKDFFVAIEWLKIPYNESKNKIKINGKDEEQISYRPSIGLNENSNSTMEAWMLDYKNKWSMFKIHNTTNVTISATIKY